MLFVLENTVITVASKPFPEKVVLNFTYVPDLVPPSVPDLVPPSYLDLCWGPGPVSWGPGPVSLGLREPGAPVPELGAP